MMANTNGQGAHRSGSGIALLVGGLVLLATAIGSGIAWVVKKAKEKEKAKPAKKKEKEKKPAEAAPTE